MKNYEKYADEIRKYKDDNFCKDFVMPYILKKDSCAGIGCEHCHMIQMIWLLEDYEEPKEPETDWSKVEVDTPILVRQVEKGEWLRRHFAKYENELIYTWKDSRTSWTELNNKNITGWKYAKLAESEEE